jgi:NADH dehydrogenase
MSKRIVIVGAGYAGVETALSLNRHKKDASVDIVLVDRNPYHTLLTELHEVAGNRVDEEAVRVPLHEIFRYTDVKTVTAEVTGFDFEKRALTHSQGTLSYDVLVLAMGGAPNYFGIPGLKENAFTLWSFDDAVRLRNHIERCFLLASQETDAAERKRLLTFIVGGAGFTGVEMMGELALWKRKLCKQYNIEASEVRLVLVDMLPTIMSNLSKKNIENSHKYLEKKLGVEVLLNTAIKEATADGVITGNGVLDTRTFIWAAGVRSNPVIDGLPLETVGGQRRIKVDEYGMTGVENVYAIGDVGGLLDENEKPYPAMVENAVQSAKGVAHNILAALSGKEKKPVVVKMHGIMVCIGRWFAVSDIMGKSLPVWLSILMKYVVNMHYLWEITGFRGVYKYLRHEWTDVRQNRTLLEKHWSTRTQAWWQFPLRLFLGGMWLYEGLKKALDGWFTSPKLAGFLGMSSDASSGATSAGLYVLRTDEILEIKTGIVNFFLGTHSRLVEGNTISEEMFVKFDLLKFGDFNLVPWFLQNVVLASDGLSMFFQVLVVVLEVLIGLMLLGGAFTFVASVISIGLMAMFLTSTGLYEKSWWMLFASIVTLGGAGRAFGLDYWLIPWVTNLWDSFWKNRKLRLFFRHGLDR